MSAGAARTGNPRRRPDPDAAVLLLVHGEDRHRVDEMVGRWKLQAAEAELGIEVIDPPAPLDRVRTSIAELPLIDPRRYLLLRDPPQLAGGRRSGEGGKGLAEALELRAPTTSICLVSHLTVAPNHPVAAAVTRLGGEVRAFPLLKGRDVRAWAETAAVERGVRLQPGSLDHLLRVAGSDLGVVAAELDKLSAYAAGEPVDLPTMRRVVGGAESVEVWNVLERLLGPEPGRGAAAAADLVDEGRSTQHLIATLAGQLSELRRAQAFVADGRSPAGLAGHLRIPEWRADRLARQARGVPAAVVEGWLRQLQAIDAGIKAGETDDRQAMDGFALGAARVVARSRAR